MLLSDQLMTRKVDNNMQGTKVLNKIIPLF